MPDYPRGPGVSPHHPPDEVWADCIDVACPNCGAAPTVYCVLELNGRIGVRHTPCLRRIKAAERQAS